MKLGNDEIAMAMELRASGLRWKAIAYHLGVDVDYLISRVSRAKREGMTK